MRQPLEAGQVASPQLAPPDGAVRAVTGAVEDQRQGGPLLSVFGEAGGGVGVVVLDRDPVRRLVQAPNWAPGMAVIASRPVSGRQVKPWNPQPRASDGVAVK